MHILIASRTSDLARIQAYQVGDALIKLHPHLKIKYHFRQSLGDINQEDPLWAMPEKGVFTQDFREGLKLGHWDMVVHSWKDLPTEAFNGTEIVATLPRADKRDLFLLKSEHLSKIQKTGALTSYSSSPRRAHNLKKFFYSHFPASLNKVIFEPVRGNILTRITKLKQASHVDGIVVAKAALDRLLLTNNPEFAQNKKSLLSLLVGMKWQVLPLTLNPTAAAQGALAIEVAKDREDLLALLAPLNCKTTWNSVQKERAHLQALGGGCHQKLGISHIIREYGEFTFVRGESPDGKSLDDNPFLPKTKIETFRRPYTPRKPWFQRERLPVQIPKGVNAHFVARSFALPEEVVLPEEDLIWTSGVKTWQDLAKRGLWVHGCSESLGEHEAMGLDALFAKPVWAKWTHNQSGPCEWGQRVDSYQLHPLSIQEDLSDYQEFFWMSGTQFELALQHFPQILKARHFCGPGRTFTLISKVLKEHKVKETQLQALPHFEAWLQLVKEAQNESHPI